MSIADKLNTAANIASRVAGFARDNSVISKGLDMIGQSKAADVARALGAGRKRKGKKSMPGRSASGRFVKRHTGKRAHAVKGGARKKGRRMKGGSFLGNILGKITSIPAGLLLGATAGTQQAISGLGRRRSSRQRGGMGTQFVPRAPVGTVSTAPLKFW